MKVEKERRGVGGRLGLEIAGRGWLINGWKSEWMDGWMGNPEYWRIHFLIFFRALGILRMWDPLYYNNIMISLTRRGGRRDVRSWIGLTQKCW